MASKLLTALSRLGHGKMVDHARGRVKAAGPKPTLAGKLASLVLMRIATKSVPGAIIITGGMIAKSLHDKHKAKKAEAALDSPLLSPIKDGPKDNGA
ncbi:MAG: hypothetical protein ABIW31_00760 [Novosphingobium sp.]